MSSINRGSLHRLIAVAEATYGVTPATPAMAEIPIVDIQKTSTQGAIQSAQLRSHPFVDRLLSTGLTHDIVVTTELQDAVLDPLFQNVFASTITGKAMKYADSLSGMTLESQAGPGAGTPFFDDFNGVFFNKLDVTVTASDTKPITCVFTGLALAGTLDNPATIASSVTPAPAQDPFVAADSTLTIAGTSRPITAVNFSASRTVDPLLVIGSRVPRQQVPGEVTLTGSMTIPYEDSVESARFTAFADNQLVLRSQSVDGSKFRTFTIPGVKMVKFARPVQTRGGILQNVDWQAHYDITSATVMTMTTQ